MQKHSTFSEILYFYSAISSHDLLWWCSCVECKQSAEFKGIITNTGKKLLAHQGHFSLYDPCVGSMIHNHGSCSSSLMGKTSLRSVCLIFTHQNVKIRQAFRSHIYTHENRRARSGLWTIFSAGNDNFFCLWTVTLCWLVYLTWTEVGGGGG